MQDITEQVAEGEAASSWLNPAHPHITWRLEGPDAHGVHTVRDYVQEELSFFAKQDLGILINSYLKRFANGDLGISVKDLFSGDLRQKMKIPDEIDPEVVEKTLQENVEIFKTVTTLIEQIPGIQHQIFVLALGVPPEEQKWAIRVMRGPVARGGLNDDQGFLILKTFLTQNARAIRDFFEEGVRDLRDHAQKEILGEDSVSSDDANEAEKEKTEEETAEHEPSPGGTPSSTIAAQAASIP